MKKVVISVLGQDRPGIIAKVSSVLFRQECNIENVSQTILQSEFSGIFIVTIPLEISIEQLNKLLQQQTQPLGLHVYAKYLEESETPFKVHKSAPFVITTRGPDRKGLVASITEIIARHQVNVSNLKAVFKGGDDPDKNIMIYEVDIPESADQKELETELREKAEELGLQISIQHRKIFEAINRI
ncbi:Amino acid-binding ACT domain-containing protein [Desulfonema limicola]|uniref:Amino acid-binding ACT domain-containing protein n=1 Tax=Desulfonema limicola TaxID=45656 RepID=A0A975BB74_9BACT|nr:ACT domain-containing protein [Desulfonema limicola]QTA82216.1 Amino acid-binding ACT domain-containing protein [Desulfonema limicola]